MAKRIFFAVMTLTLFFLSVHFTISQKPIVHQSQDHLSQVPVRWEHGWKNDRVIATRYFSAVKGYNIGFRFPRNPYHSKNTAVFEFYQKHGGVCFHAGIGPDAEQFVTFEDVHDADSADKKLQEIVPPLGELLESLDEI